MKPKDAWPGQPEWKYPILEEDPVAWESFLYASPRARVDPLRCPYPRRHGKDYNETEHGRYNFLMIPNVKAADARKTYLFQSFDLIPSFVNFVERFTNCPDPSFITTCNYLRLLITLLKQPVTPYEERLPPLFFDVNAGIDRVAMIRLHMRALLLPPFCIELLRDMVDSRFALYTRPFYPESGLNFCTSWKEYLVSVEDAFFIHSGQ